MRCERWESRAHNGFRLAGSDEDGGNPANIAASGASNQTQRDARAVQENALRASGIARRRTEGKRAEVFFLCARRRRRRIPSAQDRAPLSWTNERADMLFVCE
jgi:hypothetical protein